MQSYQRQRTIEMVRKVRETSSWKLGDAIVDIWVILDGNEWDADTADRIADVVRRLGLDIEEPEQVPDDKVQYENPLHRA